MFPTGTESFLTTTLPSAIQPLNASLHMEELPNEAPNQPSTTDATPKVVGIGGIFFFADNPRELREWYAQNLGFDITEWGSTFESRNRSQPDEVNQLQWSPFQTGSSYFEPSKKEFMINYRVQKLEELVRQLKENGVTILDDITSDDYGKFVHIMDAEGNKIELWEPC